MRRRDLKPVQKERDSSNPPTSAPIRFDPRASPLNRDSAKLRMKMIPAKNTGKQSTLVAVMALSKTD